MLDVSKKYLSVGFAAAIFASHTIESCEQEGPVTIEQACEGHKGVKQGSVERENDGGAEARCNDNVEVEQTGAGEDWITEDAE